ncbi:hypothetical protein B566_EDAN017054, partial [Ephemera danica]
MLMKPKFSRLLYVALVRPLILYGAPAWFPSIGTNLYTMESIVIRATRFILGFRKFDPAGSRISRENASNKAICKCIECSDIGIEIRCGRRNAWEVLVGKDVCMNCPKNRTLLVGRETRKLDDNMLVQHHTDESFTITCVPGFGLVNNNQLVMSVKGSC